MGEVVPPILTAEQVERLRALSTSGSPAESLAASHEALRVRVEELTAELDRFAADNMRLLAVEGENRALTATVERQLEFLGRIAAQSPTYDELRGLVAALIGDHDDNNARPDLPDAPIVRRARAVLAGENRAG